MGATFRHIADSALESLRCGGDQCHHCESSHVPVYTYHGRILDAALAKNPALAKTEPHIDELCGDCILGGNVRKHDHIIKELMRTLRGTNSEKADAVEAYHRLPELCLFQQKTWPMCCGDLAEYVGEEPLPGTAFGDYECWSPQDSLVANHRLEDFYPLAKIPVMHTMALFRCLHCIRRYWVFQYSGLFWPGPLS